MDVNAPGITARFDKYFDNENSNGFRLNVDLQLPGTGISAIFGHSGSGKTSLLRCIAGLEKPGSGYLKINNTVWQDDTLFLPTHQRAIGYVFQESALFPHINVEKNISYGLKRRHSAISSDEYQQLLSTLDIKDLLPRKIDHLSGGERQRVAIARALVTKPKLLLMDEPLSSLDEDIKDQILSYLEDLQQLLTIPVVYVSHSQREVARLARHVTVLRKGKVLSSGTFNDVFSNPQFEETKNNSSIIEVTAIQRDKKWHLLKYVFCGGELYLPDAGEVLNRQYRVRIPASDVSISLTNNPNSSILNRLEACIVRIEHQDDQPTSLIHLRLGNQTLLSRITHKSAHQLKLEPGKQVWVQIKSAAILR